MSKVSVIIPNYNHATFLKQRIESILNQTFQDLEVIILDDCSTDNSKKIIEQYRNHPKVSQIVYNDKNSGNTFKQWHKGFELAKGEYIWIAESDDLADVLFLENCINILNTDSNLNLVFTKSILINEKGEELGFNNWAAALDKNRWQYDYINDGSSEIKNYFFYRNIIPNASGVVFKKEAIKEDIWTSISSLKYTGDWLFWVSIINGSRLAYCSKPLNKFRFHNNTTRSSKTFKEEYKRLNEYIYVIKKQLMIAKKSYSTKNHAWIIEEWLDKLYLLKKKPTGYLFPPLPFKLLLLFYLKLTAKLFNFYAHRLHIL